MELQSAQALLSGAMKTGLSPLAADGDGEDGEDGGVQHLSPARRGKRVSVYDTAAADEYDEEYAEARCAGSAQDRNPHLKPHHVVQRIPPFT